MKFYLGFILFFLVTGINAQQVTYIGDTSNVYYFKDEVVGMLDSIVDDKMKYTDSTCVVYYEKEKKTIAFKSFLRGDTLTQYDYWRNGQLKKKTIRVNIKDEESIDYYEEVYCQNGQLIEVSYPSSHNIQHITEYYCNGNKKIQCDFIYPFGGFGDITEWYENGKIKSVRHRKFSNNRFYYEGNFEFYNESGGLDSIEVYKNNKLLETRKK
jgi:antitoxin component YwqK of YwqJK toxin-antitoxin module